MEHPFLDRLRQRPLLCDGAMGTMLYARGVPLDACFDVLNLHNPSLVQAIHRDYILVGAEIIETNTFGASRFWLALHGLEGQVREINVQAVKLVRDLREATGRDILVAGSIGPLGKYLAPLGTLSPEEARAVFREQAEALLEGGVDLFLLETFSSLVEITEAIRAVREVSALPIIAQMTFNDDGHTFAGHSPEEVVEVLHSQPVQVIGANCSVGSSVLYDVLVRMLQAGPEGLYSVQPNAGLPRRVGQRFIYLSSPEYMAEYGAKMLQAGARIIGGCCGTTPAHIRALRQVVDVHVPQARRAAPVITVRPEPEAPPVTAALEPTPLARKLGKEFVVTVEFDPPRGHRLEKLLAGAALLKEKGIDSLDVNDGSLGRIRMAAIPTARLLMEATGLDIILHFTCRDRNLMGIQADLLGAHALGLRNILALTGDPPRAGDYINATAVFDVEAIGLVKIIRGFNQGVDVSGQSIGEPTAFHIGVALTPQAEDLAREVDRFHQKVEAGAQWAQTQPVYDPEVLDDFFARAGPSPIPILVGILPLQSSRHAEFLHNEVPGITIPEAARRKMWEAGKAAQQVGIEMAKELLLEVRERYAGVYLMPSFGRFEVVAQVLGVLGNREALPERKSADQT